MRSRSVFVFLRAFFVCSLASLRVAAQSSATRLQYVAQLKQKTDFSGVWNVFAHRFRDGSRCLACLALLIFAILSPFSIAENPDNYKVRHQNSYNNDWRTSDQFDFTEHIKLNIVIQDFFIPDAGYAELLFTVEPGQEALITLLGRARGDGLYRGTTRTAVELQRRGLGKRSLTKGLSAVISGWPRAAHNRSDSGILINEIDLGRGPKITFQDEDLTRPKGPPEDRGQRE